MSKQIGLINLADWHRMADAISYEMYADALVMHIAQIIIEIKSFDRL